MGGNIHEAMATMTAAATMRRGPWCQCNNVTISHDEVKSREWQQRLRWQMRGCSGSCVCRWEGCCQWTGIHGKQEAPADGNDEVSEHDGNKGNEESEGVKDNEGEGNKGDNGNFPKGGGRQWTQQSTRY